MVNKNVIIKLDSSETDLTNKSKVYYQTKWYTNEVHVYFVWENINNRVQIIQGWVMMKAYSILIIT